MGESGNIHHLSFFHKFEVAILCISSRKLSLLLLAVMCSHALSGNAMYSIQSSNIVQAYERLVIL